MIHSCNDIPTNSFPDWNERIGSILLTPKRFVLGYEPSKTGHVWDIARKTHYLLVYVLFKALGYLGVIRLGEFCLNRSASYQSRSEVKSVLSTDPISMERLEIQNEHETYLIFNQITDKITYFDSIIETYEKLIQDSFSQFKTNQKAILFLICELKNLKKSIEDFSPLYSQQIKTIQAQKLGDFGDTDDQLFTIEPCIHQLATRCLSCIETLGGESQIEEGLQVSPTRGIQNIGNSCYLNAALQMLLAVPNILSLVTKPVRKQSEDSEDQYRSKERIRTALLEFVNGMIKQQDSGLLGRSVGRLRQEMFKAGLLQGGFLDSSSERSMQDVGSVFDLLLYIIGQDFTFKTHLDFYRKRNQPVQNSSEEIQSSSSLYLNSLGAVSEKIQSAVQPQIEEATDVQGYQCKGIAYPIMATQCSIVSDPQEILVFRVDEYRVQSADFTIQCGSLYSRIDSEIQYQLVGFAINHAQYHWTSVVLKNGHWYHCNDHSVVEIHEEAVLEKKASYLMYRRL